MLRSIVIACIISIVCLLVIGGPMASAVFESPLHTPVATATLAPAAMPAGVPSLAKAGWIVLGAVIGAGIVLTVSWRSQAR
jgi:hypothetical protein